MSLKAMVWVWEQQGLAAPTKLVLLALADNSDDQGVCWPGSRYIAEKTGLSRATIWRHIKLLEERGLVRREERYNPEDGQQIANRYVLNLRAGNSNNAPAPAQTGCRDATPPSHSAIGDVAHCDRGVSHSETPRTSQLEPVIEPIGAPVETSSTDASDGQADEMPTDQTKEASTPGKKRTQTGVAPGPSPNPATQHQSAAERWPPPDWWQPLTALEGYVRRDYTGTAQTIEQVCQAAGVSPRAVTETFAEYYRLCRFKHGWRDPVKALRNTLEVQVKKVLRAGPPHPASASGPASAPPPAGRVSERFEHEPIYHDIKPLSYKW